MNRVLADLRVPVVLAPRERGDAEAINLWAGEAHSLARTEPAGRVVERFVEEAGPMLAPLSTASAEGGTK